LAILDAISATGNSMAVPSSTPFTDFASDMNNLEMDGSEWDKYMFVNDPTSDERTLQSDLPEDLANRENMEEERRDRRICHICSIEGITTWVSLGLYCSRCGTLNRMGSGYDCPAVGSQGHDPSLDTDTLGLARSSSIEPARLDFVEPNVTLTGSSRLKTPAANHDDDHPQHVPSVENTSIEQPRTGGNPKSAREWHELYQNNTLALPPHQSH
jgi:hypothetical protein